MKLEKRVLIYRVTGVAGLLLFVLGIFNLFIIFPLILKSRMKKEVALKDDWSMRKIWSKLPFPYKTNFYLFNITNHREIENGEKPIVKEIGPYIYDVWQEKVDQEDHEEDDTVSYSLRRIYRFNQITSNNLSDENDIVTLPNYPRVSAASVIAAKATDNIHNITDSIFLVKSVKAYLFDGLAMPCKDVANSFDKFLCDQLYQFRLKYSLKEDDPTYYMSIWGHFNGTFERPSKFRIRRGIKNLKEIGQVTEYDEKSDFVTWNNDSRCNSFRGTDGTIFRPFLNRKGRDDLEIVNTILCRSLVYHYDSTVEYDGLPLLRYTTHLGADVNNYPHEACHCSHTKRCLRELGLLDSTLCTYVPWLVSHPHFYLANQSYVDAVDGVNPDKEKHMMFIDVDPLTGIVVRSHMRIQFNVELLSLETLESMKNFPTTILPIAWVDEIIVQPHFMIKKIKHQHDMISLSIIILSLVTICGFVMCGVAGHHEYKFRRDNQQNPVKVVPSPQNNGLVSNKWKKIFGQTLVK